VSNKSYFSVSVDTILVGEPVPYDLYVNSSAKESTEKFVRVFPVGESLGPSDLEKFKIKYSHLYIPEIQRSFYLHSLVKSNTVSDKVKTTVIKDSAVKYLGKIFDPGKQFNTEILNECIEGCKDTVEGMVEVVKNYNITGLQELIGELSFHDFYTFDHSINVSMYCIGIYKAVKPDASKEELTIAGLGGLLHDLGKIKISTDIINNPGKLSDEMFAEIQKHPQHGKELLEINGCSCDGVDLNVVKRVVYEHHENFNGTGYPNKVDGGKIHLMARVCSIADFFDALTTKRSYHDVLSIEETLHIMAQSKGKKIDPTIFDKFAQDARVLLKEGKVNLELADSFDPCQPQNELPLHKISKEKEAKDFGKIKIVEKMKPKPTTKSKAS
jgi:HD-GYP domain-containing protein (c-di-GMP phosphodiesterase class II)